MTSKESLARWALSEYRYCGGTEQAVIEQLEKEIKEAAMNETQQETWNATHAQLLKSVADAQAKLLAAQNETNDRLEVLSQRLTALTVSAAALNGNHSGLKGQLDDLVISCTGLSGRVDAIGAILAELLTVRRPVARPRAKRRNSSAAKRNR